MKELMPLDTGKALIDHSIEALTPACDSILIVTSLEKLPSIAAYVDKYKTEVPIFFCNSTICRRHLGSCSLYIRLAGG